MSIKRGSWVLVTGASQRIGAAIAGTLASDGWSVAITWKTHQVEAETLVAQLQQSGTEARAFGVDFNHPGSVEKLWNSLQTTCESPQLVVHAASEWTRDQAASVHEDSWFASLRVQAWPLVAFAQALSATAGSKPASLVALLDARGGASPPNEFSYAWGKRVAQGLVADLAIQFAPTVRVNGLALGPILAADGLPTSTWEHWLQSVPLSTTLEVSQVVESCLFLVKNPTLTGQILYVDGGLHLKRSGHLG